MNIKHFLIATAVFSAGCGGGGSDSSSTTAQSKTGVFLDSAVSGLNYQTESITGTTNASGEFLFESGENITFSIGEVDFPTVAARAVITPLDIANTQDVNNTLVINLARLLQTLDTDGDPTNGISISPTAHAAATGLSLDFASTSFDADASNLVTFSGAAQTTLISGTAAIAHLQDTLADAGILTLVGSWYIDVANKTLVTFIDESNYFVTQDVDPGETLCSDGMEAGTYTWDSGTGSLSLINAIDTTGDCGLTSAEGDTYDATAVISGNTLNITDTEGTFPISKVLDASNPISGGWYVEGGNKTLVTFINATNYFVTQDVDPGETLCSDGMEAGTYTWDSGTGSFSLINVIDTTGDCGLTSTEGETYNATITVNADVLTLTDTEGSFSANAVGYSGSVLPPSSLYAIGDTGPAGGKVFYITDGGLHGMEAAPVDHSTTAAWGCQGTLITGADGTAVGTGAQNTADILTGCLDSPIAADIAAGYMLNGFSDWFLPSKDELNLMYLNIGQGSMTLGNVGGFVNFNYWSSTEDNVDDAWAQGFSSGFQGISVKVSNSMKIRAIRAF